MKNTILFLSIVTIFGCTEPFFELTKNRDHLDVVDGKISTIEGASYIRIFEQINDSILVPIPGLNVSVIADDGEIFPFAFEASRYIPISSAFKGEVGRQYRLEAFNESISIESSFDMIPDSIPLSMVTVDTFITILVPPLNLVQKVDAVAAIALITSENESQARLRFEHSYENVLTRQIETTTFDQYALYSCDKNIDCNFNETRVPVGTTTQQSWMFFNLLIPDCRSNTGEVDISNGCIAPCCLQQDDHLTEFKVYVEAMSVSSFEYWSQIEKLTNNNGLIFDTFPFPLEGNITCDGCENEIVGIFRAVAETTATENRIL
ncbi:DUF4249 family protein [Ekhidna sp.]